MNFLINPFMYQVATPAGGFSNIYSLDFTAATSTYLALTAKTNSVDTAMRSATPVFTISFWVKPRGTQLDAGWGASMFSKYNNASGFDRNFYINLHSTNILEIYGSSNGSVNTLYRVPSSNVTPVNVWTHVALTYDSNQTSVDMITKLYINGVSASSWTTNTVATTNKFFMNQTTEGNRGEVQFGHMTNPTATFNGQLDEMQYWTTALTQSQIRVLFSGGTTGGAGDPSTLTDYTNCLIGYWRMGDNSTGDTFSGNWQIADVKGTTTEMAYSYGPMSALSKITDAP